MENGLYQAGNSMPHVWPSSCLTHDCSEVTVILTAHHLMTKPYRKGVSSQIPIIWNIVYDGNNVRGWPKIKQQSYHLKSHSVNRKMCRLLMHKGRFTTVILIQVSSELKKKKKGTCELSPTLRYFVRIKRKVSSYPTTKPTDRKHLRSIWGNGEPQIL